MALESCKLLSLSSYEFFVIRQGNLKSNGWSFWRDFHKTLKSNINYDTNSRPIKDLAPLALVTFNNDD